MEPQFSSFICIAVNLSRYSFNNHMWNFNSLLANCYRISSLEPADFPSGLLFHCQAVSVWLLPYAILLLEKSKRVMYLSTHCVISLTEKQSRPVLSLVLEGFNLVHCTCSLEVQSTLLRLS